MKFKVFHVNPGEKLKRFHFMIKLSQKSLFFPNGQPSIWRKGKNYLFRTYIFLIHTKEKEDDRMADNKFCFPNVQNTTGKCY